MIKRLDHACLSVSNIERSITFYRDALGMTPEFQEEASGKMHERVFGLTPGFRARVVQFKEGLEMSQFIVPAGKDYHLKTWDIGAHFLIFAVDDLDKTYADLTSKGVKFVSSPNLVVSPKPEGGSLKIAHLFGPDGERISLMEFIKG
jgi:catechol 2,3-dioxygenase-like lactoylglutathione lyase family enzyme